MGWAKYYEDNMSICIGRMAVREVASPVFYKRPEVVKAPVLHAVATEEKKEGYCSWKIRIGS